MVTRLVEWAARPCAGKGQALQGGYATGMPGGLHRMCARFWAPQQVHMCLYVLAGTRKRCLIPCTGSSARSWRPQQVHKPLKVQALFQQGAAETGGLTVTRSAHPGRHSGLVGGAGYSVTGEQSQRTAPRCRPNLSAELQRLTTCIKNSSLKH